MPYNYARGRSLENRRESDKVRKEYNFRLYVFEKALLIFYEQSNTGIT